MTVYYNGKIYTSNAECPVASAFVVDNGQFVYVGNDSEALSYGKGTNLGGACVIPGIVDSHCHLTAVCQAAGFELILLSEDTKPSELAQVLLSEWQKHTHNHTPDKGEKILAMGINLTKGTFCAADLDSVFSEQEVCVFSNDGHALLLNQRALDAIGITAETINPDENSYFVREDAGKPTGLVIEIPAMLLCRPHFFKVSGKKSQIALTNAMRKYNSFGITAVFEAMTVDGEDDSTLRLLQAMDDSGKLTVDCTCSFCWHGPQTASPEAALEIADKMRSKYQGKSFRLDTIKLILDGTVEDHSARLSEPYQDEPSEYGSELLSGADALAFAVSAAQKGWNIHLHAIGNAAVGDALSIAEAVKKAAPDCLMTIAHNQVYDDTLLRKWQLLPGCFFQTTPHWVKKDDYTESYLGKARYEHMFPIASAAQYGAAVTFGSDTAGDSAFLNPFLGMYFAEMRAKPEGICYPPCTEGISRQAALHAYTIGGAMQLGNRCGSIAVGKSADFSVLNCDLFAVPSEELPNIKVRTTYRCGKKVFEAEN